MQKVEALMEGQRIELEDRKNYAFNRFLNIKKSESDSEDSSNDGYVSEVFHNYSFRFARPRLTNERNQNKLNIKQLELPIIPSIINTFNKNQEKRPLKASKRYYNKLGLKPIKLLSINNCNKNCNHHKPPTHNKSANNHGYQDFAERKIDQHHDHYNLQTENKEYDYKTNINVNYDINNMNNLNNVDVDFDFDVLRLIMNEECNNNNSADDYRDDVQKISNHGIGRHDRKRVDASLNENNVKGIAMGKNKKIRFTLSKPQSPRTVQVIRVDVTTSACGRRKNNVDYCDHRRLKSLQSRQNQQNGGLADDGEGDDDYCERFRRDYGLVADQHDTCARKCTCNYCNKYNYNCKYDYHRRCTNQETLDLDFALMCKKLTLSPKE